MTKPRTSVRPSSHVHAARWLGSLLAGLLFAGAVGADPAPPTRGEVFQEVWQTVHDKFYDPHFKNLLS